jgi:hypothetical protein
MPSWPTAVCPCGPSGSASRHGRLRGGPGVLSSLAVSPFRGLVPERPGALPRLPPPSVADGPPASVTGGSGAGRAPSGLITVGVWGGHLGCSMCVVCHVVRFVFGWSLGPFPGAAQPYSYCRCLPLGSRPGLGLPLCAYARVFCASRQSDLSPWSTRVSGCGHVCVCQSSLICCPPAVFVSPRTRPVEDLPLLHGPARLLACFCLR